jgi:hypothetical protein
MIEENKETDAFKEILGLESQEQGLDFSLLMDNSQTISTSIEEEEPSMDKKSVKKIVNYLIEALKKL